MALLLVFLGITVSSTMRKALKRDVSETITKVGTSCTESKDCESCTTAFGQRSRGGAYECIWSTKDDECHSQKHHRTDEWIQDHPLGAFCPSYANKLSQLGKATMSSKLGANLFPSWLGVLPEGTRFKYALLRHERSDALAKGLGAFGNAGLNTYMSLGRGSQNPTNIVRVNALSNMFKGFQLIAESVEGSESLGQKSLRVDVSPIRRALQTLEVTLSRELLSDITEEFPIRVDAMLREVSRYPSGWPGSTTETKQIFCDMFGDFVATISMEQLIRSEIVLTASKRESVFDSVSSRPDSTRLLCSDRSPSMQNISSDRLANQRVENRTFMLKQDFGHDHNVIFLPPEEEDVNDLKAEDEAMADLRTLYLSKLVALPDKEGTLFIGHGGMFQRVMRMLWEQDKTAVNKFRGILDSRNSDVLHLGYGQSYLLLDVPGEGEMWFIIDRAGELVHGD